jgi:hypothetical protein
MHDAWLYNESQEDKRKISFTSRMIRIYRPDQEGDISFERFDWEPPLRPVNWDDDRLYRVLNQILEGLGGRPPDAIVIKDLLKGAVTNDLVRGLARMFGRGTSTRWYVSSKQWKPDWLELLKQVDLRLLFVPEVAAQEALRDEEELSCWITNSAHPAREAIAQIDKLHEMVVSAGNDPIIIVMPSGMRLVCRAESGAGNAQCFVQPLTELKKVPVPMGGASVLFPAFMACLEDLHRLGGPADHGSALTHSLQCTSDWVIAEGQRVTDPARWDADPYSWNPMPRLLDVTAARFPAEHSVTQSDWTVEWDHWEDALDPIRGDGLGVVMESPEEPQLQLWRAMTEIDGYICVESRRRENLRRLARCAKNFAQSPDYHAASMLVSAPGSGKTFLIDKLAEVSGLETIPFNVTHLSTRGEILNWFTQILEKQNNSPGSNFLVFIDEINADLAGSKPYSAFLSPLEDGVFVKEGRTFNLKPCFWIFAGTANPDPGSDKGSDFVSRLTLAPVDLNPQPRHPTEPALERVYLGASLLRHTFRDVRTVSKHVLQAFWHLPPSVRVRDMKRFVREFSEVQYTRVTAKSVPAHWPYDEGDRHRQAWEHRIRDVRGNPDRLITLV